MSEEEKSTVLGTPEGERIMAEKKKPGKIKRILKWFALSLLSILLILALIFQAPWKVTGLFVIILLACTILPKAYRKWFWLSAGTVVLILIIWVFLPEDNEGWRPYTFDDESAALQAKYAIPDSENAAIIYNPLFEDYNEAAFEPAFLDPNLDNLTLSEPWSGNDYPEIARWLQQHESTIATLIEASKIEKCQFPIVADMISGVHMEILIPMRRWAFLLVRAANNDLAENRIDDAMEKQIALLQMAKHLRQQPATIDMLTGIAIEGLSIRQFKTFIIAGDATEEYLSVIDNALTGTKHDWNLDFPKTLEYEKLTMKNFLCGIWYEVNPEGKTRLSRNPMANSREDLEMMPESEKQPYPSYIRKIRKVGTIFVWFLMPSTPQKTGKIIDAHYEQYYSMAESDYDRERFLQKPRITSIKLNFRYMTGYSIDMLTTPFSQIRPIYYRGNAEKRGTQIIIALRRYKNKTGHWPENLDEIKDLAPAEIFIDPINNDSFIYILTEENFTLYSKGRNNIDEDSQYNSTFDPNTFERTVEADDWPIWPHKKRCSG